MGRDGKDRQATHPEKEREEIEGAANCYSDISAVQKFMEVIPTPILAKTSVAKKRFVAFKKNSVAKSHEQHLGDGSS